MKFAPSLRIKFTLALLASSVLSLVFAGAVARAILFHEFNNVIMRESFRRYHSEMTEYFKKYGSWENGLRKEAFGAFEKRRRKLYGSPPQTGLRTMETSAANLKQATSSVSSADSAIRQEKGRPPFRFALADPRGKILMGGSSYKIGNTAPATLLAQAHPVIVNGRTVALALPDPHPNLNNLDLGYLQAVRHALLYAGFAAGVLALALGVVVGNRLSRRLRQLTSAIQAMQNGELRQRVEVQSHDEIGVLAANFNRMSVELAEAHEALQQSHEQISRQAKQLKELSIRDGLTGLYNRRHFDEQATRLFAEADRYNQPLSVMIGDIDFFKRINDNFSHATGDEVLRRVAQLLKANTRESDILARYGGEEFVIAFPQTSLEDAAALCEKLRGIIEEYSWREVHPDLRVTMSMGLSDELWPGSFEKMLAAADEKLYEAKTGGRNCVRYKSPAQTAREFLGLPQTIETEKNFMTQEISL
jgi:diguanylate cyclase (GGDEF)-like protein